MQHQRPEENQGGSYHQYFISPCYPNCTDPLLWWKDHERMEEDISKMAYDLLSVPAMSAECERIFSSAGMMIVPKQNCLNDDIVEASECLRSWFLRKLGGEF